MSEPTRRSTRIVTSRKRTRDDTEEITETFQGQGKTSETPPGNPELSLPFSSNDVRQILTAMFAFYTQASKDRTVLLSKISKAPPSEQLKTFEGLLDMLQAEESGTVALALLDIIKNCPQNAQLFWKLKVACSKSFSKVKWADCRARFGYKKHTNIPQWHPPQVYVSKKLVSPIIDQVEAVNIGVSCLQSANRESTVVIWVNAVMLQVCRLFQGVILNDAESGLPETPNTTGGFVEFGYKVLDLSVLLVVACKKDGTPEPDAYVQIMVELEGSVACLQVNVEHDTWLTRFIGFEASARLNTINGLPKLPIRGILCMSEDWYLFEYKDEKFQVSDRYTVASINAENDVTALVEVTKVIFNIFAEGYMNALSAFIKRSEQLSQIERSGRRRSHKEWTAAQNVAGAAVKMFQQANTDAKFDAALAKLGESFKLLPSEHRVHPVEKYNAAFKKLESSLFSE